MTTNEETMNAPTDLIRERATGIVDADINPAQAKRFADGHRFEALALADALRAMAEAQTARLAKEGGAA